MTVLSKWAESGNCPNYFIPAENMFDRHVRGDTKQLLHQVLQTLVKSEECTFLFDIETDSIVNLLHEQRLPLVSTLKKLEYHRNIKKHQLCTKLDHYLNCIQNAFEFHTRLFLPLIHKEVEKSLELMQDRITKLKTRQIFTGHTEEQTDEALRYTMPFLELSLMSVRVAAAIEQGKPRGEIWPLLGSGSSSELCTQSDSFSSKRKHASLTYMLGYHHSSLKILAPLFGLARFTLCRCYTDRIVHPMDNGIVELVERLDNFTRKSF